MANNELEHPDPDPEPRYVSKDPFTFIREVDSFTPRVKQDGLAMNTVFQSPDDVRDCIPLVRSFKEWQIYLTALHRN